SGAGTYTISATPSSNTGGGPEGIVWVRAGNPDFATDSVLISLYGFGQVLACGVNADGAPDAATCQTFITGLGGAEGATIDPVTGDFLFSTFGGGNQIAVVSGFSAPTPEPAMEGVMGLGLLGIGAIWRRRRNR